jgi:DNA-binding transcriptional MerR regulator
MAALYKIRDFAALAGVSVKALRHYHRLGLLEPRRTGAGHRRYTAVDLDRLELITALKYLGFSLKQIKSLLQHPAAELQRTIAVRRRALADMQLRLEVTGKALDVAERLIDEGGADSEILGRLTEIVHTQAAATAMRRYYTEDGWERRRRYYEEGPDREWRELYRTLASLVGEDPASDRVQAALDRWLALSVRAYMGDPAVQTDSPAAWADRENWPARMKQRIEDLNLEAVMALVEEAARCAPKKYFTEGAWTIYASHRNAPPEAISRLWQARVNLFRDVEAALEAGEAEARASQLLSRWHEQLDASGASDPDVREGLRRMWAERERWSASLRWQMEAFHMMPFDRIQRVADFLDRTAATV